MASPSFYARSLRPSNPQSNPLLFICQSCRRTKATFARQRKALRVKPDSAFAPSKTAKTDHIIFNPPSSAPNVYHTPLKFLPLSDPRRKLHALLPIASASGSFAGLSSLPSSKKRTPLPPTIRPQYEKKYHLKTEQIEEMRRLRALDPRQWTRLRLAEKFECSQFFVSLCCSSPEMKAEQDVHIDAIKARWGRKKTEAREDRQTRKALWGRDA